MQFPQKKVILVTGSNGQLGKELRQLASSQESFEFLFTSRDTLDITNSSEVQNIFEKFRPDFCINCAAYTSVDKAESEKEIAFRVNEEGVQILTEHCTNINCVLIHISTDYVYDSSFGKPIKEHAICTPRSIYGKSKRAGELALKRSEADWICIRVSWLYSSFNNNFLKTMIKLGNQKGELKIVSDQQGSPTYAKDLAEALMTMINSDELKTAFREFYNFSNKEKTTWSAFAKEIFNQTEIECNVLEISTKEYNAAAPRPLWSVLDLAKIKDQFDILPVHWKTSLSNCLSSIDLENINQ